MGFVDWLLRRPPTELHIVYNWGEFPPTPHAATPVEVQNYLEKCSFAGLRIHADNRLTVILLDADDQPWTFYFPNAGLSINAWPDGTPPFAEGLSSENWGPQSSINYLATSTTRDRKGQVTQSYELETTVLLMNVDSDPVHVAPPGPG